MGPAHAVAKRESAPEPRHPEPAHVEPPGADAARFHGDGGAPREAGALFKGQYDQDPMQAFRERIDAFTSAMVAAAKAEGAELAPLDARRRGQTALSDFTRFSVEDARRMGAGEGAQWAVEQRFARPEKAKEPEKPAAKPAPEATAPGREEKSETELLTKGHVGVKHTRSVKDQDHASSTTVEATTAGVKAGHKRSSKDRSMGVEAALQGGKLTGSVEGERSGRDATLAGRVAREADGTMVSGRLTTMRDGTSTNRAGRLRVGDDGRVEGELDAEERRHEERDGKKVETARGAGVRYGKDGLALNARRERAEGDKKTVDSLSYAGGDATLARTRGDSSARLSVGEHGVHAGYDASRTRTLADGSTAKDTVGVNANLGEGKVGATYGHTFKGADGKTAKLDAAGNLDVDRHGNIEAADGKAAFEQGKTSVSASAGFKVKATPVQLADKSWVVKWEASATGGASLGTGAEGKESGAKVGATVSAEGGRTVSGMHRCKDKESAEAYAEDAAGHLAGELVKPVASVEDALAMPVGDVRSVEDRAKGALGATATAEGVTVGGKIEGGRSERLEIVRKAGGVVEVTLAQGSQKGASGTIGATGVEAGMSGRKAHSDEVTVRFDLETPAGKKAFAEFTTSHRLVDGGTQIADATEDEKGGGRSLSLVGARFDTDAMTRHREAHDREGHTTREDTGQRTIGASIPLLGSFKREVGLFSTELDGKERAHMLHETITSTDSKAVNDDLAAFAGVDTSLSYGKVSGSWTISQSVADKDVAGLVGTLRDGGIPEDKMYLLKDWKDEGEALRAALAKAKSPNEEVQAIDAFLAATGKDGAAFVQKMTGVKPQTDLELKDEKGKVDANFQGAGWRVALEGKIGGLNERLSDPKADKGKLVKDVVAEIQALMIRRAGITDPDAYTDLPQALRAQEVARTDAWIARLEAIEAQATAQARGPEAFGPLDRKGTEEAQRIAALDAEVADARARFTGEQQTVVRLRDIHEGAGSIAGGSARRRLGKGWLLDGAETQAYAAADGGYASGKANLAAAQIEERAVVAARAEYNLASAPEERARAAASLQSLLAQLAGVYRAGAEQLVGAEGGYRGIEGRHGDDRGLFEGHRNDYAAHYAL